MPANSLLCSCIHSIIGEVEEDLGQPDPADAQGLCQLPYHCSGRALTVILILFHYHETVEKNMDLSLKEEIGEKHCVADPLHSHFV